jgi:hypothetical protein
MINMYKKPNNPLNDWVTQYNASEFDVEYYQMQEQIKQNQKF